jgi:glyoxylase-like metal-dependent hydrolase (beta-lactamase superfamily II)
MKRVAVAGLFLLALVAVWQRGVQTLGPVRQLAPGVYSYQGDIDRQYRQPANTSWVEFKNFVVVIDANTPFGAKVVLPEIRKTTSKPIRYAFDTHYHWDHTQGNSVYADEGATIVCSQGCATELLGPKGQGEWNSGMKRSDKFSLAPYRLEPPSLTFSDAFAIDDGERRLEFKLVGPGHTIGDAVAYLPKEQIVFTGDLVVNWKYGNNLADAGADIPHWSKLLLDMATWNIQTVIPGHGDPGTVATLKGQSAFLTDVWTQVSEGKKAGKTLEQLQAEVNLSKNGDWAADQTQNRDAIRAAFRKAN